MKFTNSRTQRTELLILSIHTSRRYPIWNLYLKKNSQQLGTVTHKRQGKMEFCEFEASLFYIVRTAKIVRPCLERNKRTKRKKKKNLSYA